jgi:hypothetical protein
MAGKKIKLDKEAISEILVADTDSESGSEASDFLKLFYPLLSVFFLWPKKAHSL